MVSGINHHVVYRPAALAAAYTIEPAARVGQFVQGSLDDSRRAPDVHIHGWTGLAEPVPLEEPYALEFRFIRFLDVHLSSTLEDFLKQVVHL